LADIAVRASVELAAMAVLFLRTWAVWRKSWYIAAACISLSKSASLMPDKRSNSFSAHLCRITNLHRKSELIAGRSWHTNLQADQVHFTHVPIFRSQGPCIATGVPKSPAFLYFAWPLIYDIVVTVLLMVKLIPIARHVSSLLDWLLFLNTGQTNMSDTLSRLFREGTLFCFVASTLPTLCVRRPIRRFAVLRQRCQYGCLAVQLVEQRLASPHLFCLAGVRSFPLKRNSLNFGCSNLTSRMILSLRSSGESQDAGLETKSFWSRVQKDSTVANPYQRDPNQFSVNIHKIETTVCQD
jgi:hypothetical protein